MNTNLIMSIEMSMYARHTLGLLAGTLPHLVMFAFYPWLWEQ